MLVKVGLKPDDPGRFLSAFPEAKRQRVAVARALILRPALVVVDEALTALNLAVQLDTASLLRDLQHEFRLPCLFITRDLRLARRLCDRIAVMYAGRVVEIGTGEEIFTSARHPYTRALVATIPSLNPDIRTGSPLDGPPVDTADLPPGCPFHPRCPAAQPGLCDRPGHPPELERLPHGGAAACFRAEELAEEEPLRSGSPL
jgi:peptide/nickel transport system ATP-binding protein